MLPRNAWLVAPFVVLAIVVASFTVTPLWIQHRATQVREPAYTALASSMQAIGALIDMRDQLHRAVVLDGPTGDTDRAQAARQFLAASLLAYASTRAGTPSEIPVAFQRFLSAAGSPDPRLRQNASERLNRLLMDELAAE